MLYLFWNPIERRVRAGWRILIHGLVFLLASVLVQLAVFQILIEDALRFVYPLSGILISLLVLWLAGRFLDRRRLVDFGFHLNRGWWLDLGFGLLLGAVLMALIFWFEQSAGWLTVTATYYSASASPFWIAILFGLWGFIAVGISEEILSRGYHLRNLAEGFNFPRVGPKTAFILAYVISSSMFGLFHLGNPNATWVSSLLIMGAGFMLGLGYVLTGELSIPIGLHITWNFFQGRVFGFPVSGSKSGASFLAIEQGGPLLWTGGDFGPEAGLIGLAAMILGCLLTLLWVRWRRGKLRLQERLAVYEPELPEEPEAVAPFSRAG